MFRKLSLVAFAFAAPLAAQTTWFVGPSGYAQIRDVTPLVSNGDVIEVAPGSYFDFRVTRAVTIRAQVPGTVSVNFSILGLPPSCGCLCMSSKGPTRLLPPAGSTLHVVGIDFGGTFSVTPCFGAFIHDVVVGSGRVTFDGCTIDRLRVANAVACLQDCVVDSNIAGAGIVIDQGDVTIAGGTVSGSDQSSAFGASTPKPAISMTGGRLHASHVTITGGDPGASGVGAFGIDAIGGSVWLSDATVTGQLECAVRSSGLLRMDRVTLIDGGVACPVSPMGAPLLGMERNGPIQIGSLFQATMTSQPGDLQIFYGATGLGHPLLLSLVDQPIWIEPDHLFFSLLGVADAFGQTTFAFAMPNLPILIGYEYWVQGVGGATFPLQTTPPVGGITR